MIRYDAVEFNLLTGSRPSCYLVQAFVSLINGTHQTVRHPSSERITVQCTRATDKNQLSHTNGKRIVSKYAVFQSVEVARFTMNSKIPAPT